MATASARPHLASNDIKLEYGVPQTFALKFAEGKSVESRYPGGRVMFTAIDDRKLFLDDEDAGDLERTMRELRLGVADFMRVTKIKHPRGGGHSLRVERVPDEGDTANAPAWVRDVATAPPSRTEALLEKSVELARAQGPAAFRPAPEPQAVQQTAHTISPTAVRLCATMCALVDSMTEAKTYAQRRGIDLTNEDLRCLVTTAFIQDSRGAR